MLAYLALLVVEVMSLFLAFRTKVLWLYVTYGMISLTAATVLLTGVAIILK